MNKNKTIYKKDGTKVIWTFRENAGITIKRKRTKLIWY